MADCRLLAPPPRVHNRRRRNLLHTARSASRHRQFQFIIENVQHALDPLLAKSRQPPNVWPSDTDGICSQRESLKHIGTAAKPTIDNDRNPSTNSLGHF